MTASISPFAFDVFHQILMDALIVRVMNNDMCIDIIFVFVRFT